jgi:hypothetical protein
MNELLYYPKKALQLLKENSLLFLKISLLIAGVGIGFDLLTLLFPSVFSGPFATALLLILRLLALSIFNIALFKAVKAGLNGEPGALGEILADSKKHYKNYIYISIILFVIILAGIILFIIPGVIFAAWYFASSYLVATEDMKPMAALDLSKKRVEGKFGQVLLKFFISFLVLPLPLIVIVSLLTGLGNQSTLLASVLVLVANFIFVTILSPYMYAVIALIYEDLKK